MPINSFLYPGAKFVPPYEVANSCRFDDGSSDSLYKTFSSDGNKKTFTFSAWVKRGIVSSGDHCLIATSVNASDDNTMELFFQGGDKLAVGRYYNYNLITNALFRDSSAWYHIVLACDTTQSTASNRMRLYVNGSEITSFATASYPNQNDDLPLLAGSQRINIAAQYYTHLSQNTRFLDGYMTEVVMVDNQQLDPTLFGEFDSDSPNIWKPIDVSGLTFGTNGFYLDFENASSLGADVSGNSNNFTVNNLTSVDQSTDTCTNNFATLNPLDSGTITFSDGNLTATSGSDYHATKGTIGVNTGKWYFEAKINAPSGGSAVDNFIGITGDNTAVTGATYDNNPSVIYTGSGTIDKDGTAVQSSLTTFSTGTIVGVALNMDDSEIEFYINGSKQGSTQSISSFTGFYLPFYIGANNRSASFNFGSPSFSISSGNADANGHGNFEYSVPSGYFALCTKNLAENG